MKKLTLLLIATLVSNSDFAQAPRKVVVEDFTGTWCGYCPRGKTTIEDCITTYPTTIGMEVHTGDTHATTYSEGIITGLSPSGYPNGAIDRFAFSGTTACFSTNVWKSKVATRLNTTSPVNVGITTTYNTSTRALSVTVTANFVGAASGDIRISCLLTEDAVVTPSDPQHNYMDATVGDPWYGQGSTIPNYVHNGVARMNLANDIWGTAGVIPASVTAGGTYNKTYTYTVPSTWNANKVYVVGMVNKRGTTTTTNEILNAARVLIGSNTVGVEENTSVDPIQVKQSFPNPFSDITALQFKLNTTDNVSVKVYNSYGQLVNTLVNTKLTPGDHTFYWAGNNTDGSLVSTGVYHCVIATSSTQITRPMVFVNNQ